jgi:ABC-type Fe3+-siderophore transport system permease subunit
VLAGTLLGSVLLGALVGVVTAFTGAPFFLVVLRAARRSA